MGKYKVVLTDEAVADLQEAYQYYESQSDTLGFEFFYEMESELEKLETFPHFQKVHKHYRRIFNKRFKYNIYFYVEENPDFKSIVVAFIHSSRHPDTWENRIKPS